MKKLFTVIRQGRADEVAAILDRRPELIACTAAAPPKKDVGQSPLMVAVKSDNLEVAHLLLDRGADVNFRDEPSQPHNESVPIWFLAVGQCFLRAGDTVSEKSKERSKGYFLLLRRLLDMGMDPNQRATADNWSRNAWQMALDEYNRFAYDSYADYKEEMDRAHNRQLQEMLRAVLDLLLAHGADIHAFDPPRENGMPVTAALLRNLEEGRELLDGFYGLDPEELKPFTFQYRGRERVVQPMDVEVRRQRYEVKWRALEPVLRGYYERPV